MTQTGVSLLLADGEGGERCGEAPWQGAEASKERSKSVREEFLQQRHLKIDSRNVSESLKKEINSTKAEDSDEFRTMRRRALAVMRLMTTGRLSTQLRHRDIFDLFIGGYSEDFNIERNLLHIKLVPECCRWCLDAGIEFNVVDFMHCTNYNVKGTENITVYTREAVNSKSKSTMGINYISLVGNKLGPRPLPQKISKTIFLELLNYSPHDADRELVKFWYVIEPLSFPQQFLLLSPYHAAEEVKKGADVDDLLPEDKIKAFISYLPIEKKLRYIMCLTQSQSSRSALHFNSHQMSRTRALEDYGVSTHRILR
jgi:hypothetical protein